jgi:hypothetical protein
MSLEDRARLFGDPTDKLVAEAVWLFRDENGSWPFWNEALEDIARLNECDEGRADELLGDAIHNSEVEAKLNSARGLWRIELPEAMHARITRRLMDRELSQEGE